MNKFRRVIVSFVLPIIAPIAIILTIFFSYLTYRITHPLVKVSEVGPYYHGLPYSEVEWRSKGTNAGRGKLTGWFIPGSRGAPAIILCHGYGSNQYETLDIAATLHKNGYYSVLVFNMRGHGQKDFSRSSLGFYEKDDVLGAIDYVLNRPEVDRKVGLWGASIGAYAALAAAAETEKVAAVAADSVYPTIESFVQVQARELLGSNNYFLTAPIKFLYALYFLTPPNRLSEPVPMQKLSNVNLLFLTGSNNPALASLTRRIYIESNGRRDILSMDKVRDEFLTSDERKLYNERILGFFRKTMPVAGFSSDKRKQNMS